MITPLKKTALHDMMACLLHLESISGHVRSIYKYQWGTG